ncbi:hypothetical protein HYU92_05815 [Candidatus Curtissbacteria bacterium]|nr:hypothetical protein [Candidatus Curtissbacteria bacterium]
MRKGFVPLALIAIVGLIALGAMIGSKAIQKDESKNQQSPSPTPLSEQSPNPQESPTVPSTESKSTNSTKSSPSKAPTTKTSPSNSPISTTTIQLDSVSPSAAKGNEVVTLKGKGFGNSYGTVIF